MAHTARALYRDRDRFYPPDIGRRPRFGYTGDRACHRRLHYGVLDRGRASWSDRVPTVSRGDGRHRHLLPRLLDARLFAPDGTASPIPHPGMMVTQTTRKAG